MYKVSVIDRWLYDSVTRTILVCYVQTHSNRLVRYGTVTTQLELLFN